MKTMTGKTESRHSTLAEVLAMETGDQAAVHGMVHTLRDLGRRAFCNACCLGRTWTSATATR